MAYALLKEFLDAEQDTKLEHLELVQKRISDAFDADKSHFLSNLSLEDIAAIEFVEL